MATHRIPAAFDLVAQFGLRLTPEMQEIGRELYNDACTTGSDVHLSDRAPDRLDVEQQGESTDKHANGSVKTSHFRCMCALSSRTSPPLMTCSSKVQQQPTCSMWS
jgi:hypothetical protein